MSIVHNVEQGTQEWRMLRAGIPTASNFHRILTAKEHKPSKQANDYMLHLLAERILGGPIDTFSNGWTERGNDLEDEAARLYEYQSDTEIERIGFVTNDAGTYGASPDRLVGEEGLVQIKCPSPQVHIAYMLDRKHNVEDGYFQQLQGELLVTGRKWIDIISYHPVMPHVVVRVERNEEFIGKLTAALDTFCQVLDLKMQDIERLYGKIEKPEPKEWLSDADVEMILSSRRNA